jgi:hypothetical protein
MGLRTGQTNDAGKAMRATRLALGLPVIVIPLKALLLYDIRNNGDHGRVGEDVSGTFTLVC